MTVPYEALSRLLSEDLDPSEAAALRHRIDTEPAVAEAWEAMQALPDLLAGPLESPPPALDRKVVTGAARPSATVSPTLPPAPPRAAARPGPWIAAGLAALLALTLALRPDRFPTLVPAMGGQWVDGRAELLAGDVRVQVDGVASIFVEPAEGALRGSSQEAEAMNRSHLLAALAGAVITVAVYEGSAVLSTPSAEAGTAIELGAGERAAVVAGSGGLQRAEAGTRPVRRIVRRQPGGDSQASAGVLDKDEEIAALRDEVARLQLAAQLDKGRIEAIEGVPQAWPDELPAPFRPENFEQALRDSLGDLGGEIAAIDCSEYPCLAVLSSDLREDEWRAWMDSIGDRLDSGGLGGETDVGLGLFAHQSKGPEGDVMLLGLAVSAPTEGDEPDPDLQARTHRRMTDQLSGMEEEIRGEAEAE